ncbi:ATP-binding protein [Streptomyces sp. ST2-7A]|uniref:ATP-binding protein n=1 Tax=Streptomyces sp. ST2-7A TaxID=2907214 RepID=UPI001F2797F5|nr:ATP-binding protein [Streptomyces sp. ST2-7A]MCE7079340.1 ATP-binding protein [Streptomyces sp. ST2-7A]
MGLRVVPRRVGRVRRLVEDQLHRWDLPDAVDTVLLGTTELVANVHRHAGPDKRCTIELVLRGDRLTVIVFDHGPGLPRERRAGPDAGNGRGLALVAALGESWGARVRPGGRGKAVWFTLRLSTGEPGAGSPGNPLVEPTGDPPAEVAVEVAGVTGTGIAPAGSPPGPAPLPDPASGGGGSEEAAVPAV